MGGLMGWLDVFRDPEYDPRKGRYSWSEIEKAKPSALTARELADAPDEDD
jgi:hypothetical protein